MLSALMMQGVVPGPTLFTEQTSTVYTIIAGSVSYTHLTLPTKRIV